MSRPAPVEERRRAAAAILASFRLAPADDGLEYATRGDGPAVVALHGGLGGWDQGALLAHLALADVAARVIAPSRPGHLGSPAALGRTADAQAEAIVRRLDRLRIDRATILAISGGGPTAVAFARRRPDRCRALIPISAVTDRFDPHLPFGFRVMRSLARWPSLTAVLAARDRADPDRADRRGLPDPELRAAVTADHDTAAALLALRGTLFDRPRDRFPGLDIDLALCRAAATPAEGEIRVPTLIIHAVDDPVVPDVFADRLAAVVPWAETLRLPSGGHMALFAHRRRIAGRIADFLAPLGQPRRDGLIPEAEGADARGL
jgi:pimeloyl-ACP methyl ester carboxylesterase